MWHTMHGRPLGSSLEVPMLLGDHVAPGFVLLMPVYAIAPHPLTLIVIQTVWVAAGGWVVAWLTRRMLGDRSLPIVLVTAGYLFGPSAGGIVGYDFHPIAMASTAGLLAIAAFLAGRTGWGIAALVLTVSFGERGALMAAGVGTWLFLFERRRGLGAGVVVASLAYFWVAVGWIVPHFRGAPADALSRFEWLGESPAAIVRTCLLRPGYVAWHLLSDPLRMSYLIRLGLPFAMLVWRRPAALLPVVWPLAANLLSDRPAQHQMVWQYDATVWPLMALAAILAWRTLRSRRWVVRSLRRRPGRWIAVHVAALLVANGYNTFVHWAPTTRFDPRRWADLRYVAAPIGGDDPLSASMNLGPHFAHRRQLRDYPRLGWEAGRFPDLQQRAARWVLVDVWFEGRHHGFDHWAAHRRTLARRGYRLVRRRGDFRLFERAGSPDVFPEPAARPST